jgi:hypothetical protein
MYKITSKLTSIKTVANQALSKEKGKLLTTLPKMSISSSNSNTNTDQNAKNGRKTFKHTFNKASKKSIFNFNFNSTKSKKGNPFDNSDAYTEEYLKNKKEEYFEVEEHLVFQNGKLPIISANSSDKSLAKRLRNYVVFPILALTGYKFVKSLILLRPFRSMFWGFSFYMSVRVFRGLNINKYYFIYSINLMQDGKRIELIGEGEPIIADMKEIRRLSPEENIYVAEMFPDARVAYLPIVVKDQFFLIFKNSKIHHKEIFKAVSLSKYIRVKEEQVINKDNAIDIS